MLKIEERKMAREKIPETEKFEISLKKLCDLKNDEIRIKKRMDEIRAFYGEFKSLESEYDETMLKQNRLHSYLNHTVKSLFYGEEKEICQKLIEAKENHKRFADDIDNLLFDELGYNSVSYDPRLGQKQINISLRYEHFRKGNLFTIMKRVEEITSLFISNYYMSMTDGKFQLSLELVREKPKEDKK